MPQLIQYHRSNIDVRFKIKCINSKSMCGGGVIKKTAGDAQQFILGFWQFRGTGVGAGD